MKPLLELTVWSNNDLYRWPNIAIDTSYTFLNSLKLWYCKFIFNIRLEFENTCLKKVPIAKKDTVLFNFLKNKGMTSHLCQPHRLNLPLHFVITSCHTLQYLSHLQITFCQILWYLPHFLILRRCDIFLSNFVKIVTLCKKYWMDLDPWPGIWDIGPGTKKSGTRTRHARLKMQDPLTTTCNWGSKTHGQKPRPRTWDLYQSLGFILHTVWTFLVKMIFVIWKYQLEIDGDISINIWIKSLFYIKI